MDKDEILLILQKQREFFQSGKTKGIGYRLETLKKLIREFMSRTKSGSAAISDTVMLIASPWLPYGGVGCSGIGRYQGRKSFETFSSMRSVLVKSNLTNILLCYPPYTPFKEKVQGWLLNLRF